MHPVLIEIHATLKVLATSLQAFPNNEPVNITHVAWNVPSITRDELVQVVESAILYITERETDQLGANEALIADYNRRLAFLNGHTIPHIFTQQAAQAIPAFMFTMQGLQLALQSALPNNQDIAHEISLARANTKKLTKRYRALAATIDALEPRSNTLEILVDRIEKASSAADELPVDLAALNEARETIKKLLTEVTADSLRVATLVISADVDKASLIDRVKEAERIVALCSSAYAASTSHGLAAAFAERSHALGRSMWVWVGGLVIALGLGSWIGSAQLRNFSELIKQPDSNLIVVVINLVLTLLSVGATVWFSWLATKQIGQRFRLAEDYGFKASVSRAYEGYRREAANIDEAFVSRLFSSALSRLDEQPLRLVETATHGSPWHELASSHLFRKAIELVPDFASSVSQLAKDGLAALNSGNKPTPIVKAPASNE
jgi:hypothetical protein